jgi:hypothetical protein
VPKAQPINLVLYTRKGCHLCDDAYALLEHLGREYQLYVEVIDIDTDPRLVERFTDMVPVIALHGRPRQWGRINPVLLRRLLDKEGS